MTDIPLEGKIEKARVDWVLSKLRKGDRLVINSGGGDLFEASRLADFVRQNNIDTHVFSTGIAHSSAALVFSAGNKRTAGKNAQFMIHPPTQGSAAHQQGVALLQNKLIQFGVKGSPDFIKAQTQDVIWDHERARMFNLINADNGRSSTIIGPLE